MVEQHHVDRPDVEALKRLVDGGLRIRILVRIKLCDHEDLIPGDAGAAHGFAHLAFVPVDVRGIDEAHAVFERLEDRRNAAVAMKTVGADAVDRHLDALLNFDGARCHIEASGIGRF